MMTQSHPTPEALSDFVQGRLEEVELEQVSAHLDACSACQRTLDQLSRANDTLIGKVREAGAAIEPQPGEASAKGSVAPNLPKQPIVPREPAAMPGLVIKPVSWEQVQQILTDLELVSTDDLAALRQQLLAASSKELGSDALRDLTDQGKLTKYQAHAIFQEKAHLLSYGEYTVLDRLGAGGMGQVFKAVHRRMRRIVALKVLSSSALKNPEAVRRFEREATAAAKLSHPAIVSAYDLNTHGKTSFLVMEYIEGRDLSKIVDSKGPLPVNTAIDYILQAAEALAFAHSHGIIHRDIKPANLLIDRDGRLKVLDLGLAKFEGAGGESARTQLTVTAQVMGTVDYMAPEQALNTKKAEARSDIYSLGCTLYRLLTNQSVYDGETITERFLNHREAPIPSLRVLRPDVPESLDELFRYMVGKKPEDRPATMAEVVKALEQIKAAPLTSISTLLPPPCEVKLANPAAIPAVLTPSLPTATPVQRPQASQPIASESLAAGLRRDGPPRKRSALWAIASTVMLLAVYGVWVLIRDREGNEVGRQKIPDGGQAVIAELPAPGANVNTGQKKANLLGGPSAIDSAPTVTSPPPANPTASTIGISLPKAAGSTALVEKDEHGSYWKFPRRDGIESVAISPDNAKLLVVWGFGSPKSHSLTVGLWNVSDGSQINEFVASYECGMSGVFSSDGDRMLLGSCRLMENGIPTAWLLDATSGREIQKFRPHESPVHAVAISRDGGVVATGTFSGVLRIWNTSTNQITFRNDELGRISAITFSPDSTQLLLRTSDSVRLFDLSEMQQINSWKHPVSNLASQILNVGSEGFSPDGRRILITNHAYHEPDQFEPKGSRCVRVVSVSSGQTVWSRESPHPSALFSLDDRYVLHGDRGVLYVLDSASGKEMGRTDLAFDLENLCLSTDGKLLYSWDVQGNARIWEYADILARALRAGATPEKTLAAPLPPSGTAPVLPSSTAQRALPGKSSSSNSTAASRKKLNDQIIEAAENDNWKEVETLIVRGADPNTARSTINWTPLMFAVSTGTIDAVKMLIANRVKIDITDVNGFTALMRAVENSHHNKEIVGLLLDNGASVDAKDKYGRTILMHAVRNYDAEVFKLILSKKPAIETKDTLEGKTALAHAVERERQSRVYVGLGVPAPDQVGPSRKDAVIALLAKGADPNAKEEHGYTVLCLAVRDGQVDVVKLLLDGGVSVDIRNHYDGTELYEAVLFKQIDAARLLLDHKADPNIQSKWGDTALIRLCQRDDPNLDFAKILLAHGARIDIRDGKNKTALDYAEEKGHKEIAAILRTPPKK